MAGIHVALEMTIMKLNYDSIDEETNSNLEAIFSLKIQPKFISKEDIEKAFSGLKAPDVIIDAIFGIGLKGLLDNFYIKLIEKISDFENSYRMADIPSGLDLDMGAPMPSAIKANVTVTFGYPKAGFKNEIAKPYLGKLVIADIGLSREGANDKPLKQKFPEKILYLRSGKKGNIKPGHP